MTRESIPGSSPAVKQIDAACACVLCGSTMAAYCSEVRR